MLDQVLATFGIAPDVDLDVMRPAQTLFQLTSRILTGLEPVLDVEKPDLAIVQGDTTTTLCASLAAFYKHIPVGHVEAGLRTGDLAQPYPEEMNRVLTSRLAALHFAATERALANLCSEGVARSRIAVTGNTVIDALLHVSGALLEGRLVGTDWPWLDNRRRLIPVTVHRRESFGARFEGICKAVSILAERPDVCLVFPVHANPYVRTTATRMLANHPNVHLLPPLDYVPFVDLMRRAHFLLTDSGGIQEEAPSLGKPVLVLREVTERQEAVEAGTVKLVGTDVARIVAESERLLDEPLEYQRMARAHNPYGDGQASQRIECAIASYFAAQSRPGLD